MSLLLVSLLLGGPMAAEGEPIPAITVSQARPQAVPVGDARRRVLLDTIRPAIEARVDQPVQFMVDKLVVLGDWAFYAGSIQKPNGRPIDFSRTSYAEALREGMFDGPTTYALLQRRGSNWRLVEFIVGPTDVAYLGWAGEFGAPDRLFE